MKYFQIYRKSRHTLFSANLTLYYGKDDFPLYNTNQKIKLVTKNKEPDQKHAKLIYCVLFT
jgi:hypothetical protein